MGQLSDNGNAGFSSVRKAWREHQEQRDALIRRALDTTNQWISDITDDDMPAIGAVFQACFEQTACREEVDIYMTGALAVYNSFGISCGFTNKIKFGPSAEEDLARLFSSRVHERVHAIQKAVAPVTHAHPFNPATDIVLCPQDALLLEEYLEKQAYVMQAWFNARLADEIPEVKNMTMLDSLSVADFAQIRKENSSIGDTLRQSAAKALDKRFKFDDDGAAVSFCDHYHDVALCNYRRAWNARLSHNCKPVQFVRLEAEDIEALSGVCGIDMFDAGQGYIAPPVLNQYNLNALLKLNDLVGVSDYDSLPTLSGVLAARGISKDDFLRQSLEQQPPQPATDACGAKAAPS